MIPDPNSLTVAGALVLLTVAVMRHLYARVERMEQRAEKRMDALESEVKTLRDTQVDTSGKYNWLKGWTERARNCSVSDCPNRASLTPATGTRIGSEPGQPSKPKITPLLPR